MKLKKTVVVTKREYEAKKIEIKNQMEAGTIEVDMGTQILVNLKQRKAKIIKIGRKTFETKVSMLKKKFESKKISVKKYKDRVTKLRSHMTISLGGY